MGQQVVVGTARVDAVTKRLVSRLRPGDVAIIAHEDLDGATACSLRARRPGAVVNGRSTLSGRLPARGAGVLLEAGIPILDEAGPEVIGRVAEGMRVRLEGDRLMGPDGRVLGEGRRLTAAEVARRLDEARRHLDSLLARFVDNTLERARCERDRVLGSVRVPPLVTPLAGRPAVVAVRGLGLYEDLRTLIPFIRRVRPVLIGVDGGGDALIDLGLGCDLIVGDMDSVSDRALRSGAELVVQAYPAGGAPGLARVLRLGLFAHVMPCPGTSEDAALLLAHEAGARPIVAVGCHASPLDVLEKGRPGMASTVLVRLRVGDALVDARGLREVYSGGDRAPEAAVVAAAALAPLAALAVVSAPLQQLLRLLWLRVQAGLWAGMGL